MKVSPKTLARFQRVAARYDAKVVRAEFEPLGIHMVFDGPTGGWTVEVVFPARHKPFKQTCIGYNIKETIGDIQNRGDEAMRWLKRPYLTIPTTTEQWHQLARTLYRDTVSLMALEERATALKDGDKKGAWEIVKILRERDANRLEQAKKEILS